MKVETNNSAIAANAMLAELLRHLMVKGVIAQADINNVAINAARKLNETKEPVFEEAAKAVIALYKR